MSQAYLTPYPALVHWVRKCISVEVKGWFTGHLGKGEGSYFTEVEKKTKKQEHLGKIPKKNVLVLMYDAD